MCNRSRMGRRPRDQAAGMYHVNVRAVAGSWLFKEIADYETRLSILEAAVRKKLLAVNQLCLMGNHEHLIVTAEDGRLGAAMQWINRDYAVSFNTTYNRVGRLYDGPYKSKRIVSERHALWVVSYIALNPEEVFLGRAETYRWSSYPELVGLRKGFSFVDHEPIIDLFGGGEVGVRRIREAVDAHRGWLLQRARSERRLRNLVPDEVPLGQDDLRSA
jgi:REP element-mobilizing transposase RayT